MGNGASILAQSNKMSVEDKMNVISGNGQASNMNPGNSKHENTSARPAYLESQYCQGSTIAKSATANSLMSASIRIPCSKTSDSSETFAYDCWDSDQSSCGYPNISSFSSSSTLPRTLETYRNDVINSKRFNLITEKSTFTRSLDSARSQTTTSNCSDEDSYCYINPVNQKPLRRNKNSTKAQKRTIKTGQKAFIKFVPELKKRPNTAPGFVDLSIKSTQPATSDSVSINSSVSSKERLVEDENNRNDTSLRSTVLSKKKSVADIDVANETSQIKAKIDASSQTDRTESVGIQCNLFDKNCFSLDAVLDVNGLASEKILDFAIEAVSQSQHLDKLRTISAQSPRRQLSQANYVNQRCKSAYAILLTQTRMSNESNATTNCHTTLTSARVEIESTKVISSDSESLSSDDELPEAFSTQMHRAKSQIIPRRPCTSFPRPMSLPAVRNTARHSKMLTPISDTKMNELFKAYSWKGREYHFQGLNFSPKKMRLPMHCGYKTMTAEEISDIVDRLSSSKLSSRRIHECYGCANVADTSCKSCQTKQHCRSLLNETRYRVNHLSSSTKTKRKKWRKCQQNNRELLELENTVTKSLRQINSSLEEANKALDNLTSIMDAVTSCSGVNGFTYSNSKMIKSAPAKDGCSDKLPKTKHFVNEQRRTVCGMKIKQSSSDISRTKPCKPPVQGEKRTLLCGMKRFQSSLTAGRTNQIDIKLCSACISKTANATKKKPLKNKALNSSQDTRSKKLLFDCPKNIGKKKACIHTPKKTK